jgi:CPA1 family monovalent cation:H+ antiporter
VALEALFFILISQVVIIVLVTAARRVGLPYPILLVLGGIAVGYLPGVPRIHLEPELVLLVFLPPVLFSAALRTPLRDFRANLRGITLLAVGLVIFTTVVVAVVIRLAVPDMPWAAAFALGAIVSPPDAIAATAVFRRLGVPRRLVTVLEGESLLNDATALVAYRAAVAAVAATLSLSDLAVRFVVVSVGGALVGLAVGFVAVWVYRRLEDPPIEIAISFLVPFAAYLPAERLGLSGVVAAVVAGLYVGRRSSRVLGSDTRILGSAAWEIVIFQLNGFAFVLLGLALPELLAALSERPPAELLRLGLLVSGAAILARIVWVFPAVYVPRFLSASLRAADPYPPVRIPFILGWSGMRGVVSLAAALALPIGFPERDLILFLTFCVIVATLVGQGLSLPWLIRRLGLSADDGDDVEERAARQASAEAALRELDVMRKAWPSHLPLVDQLETTYRHRLEHLPTADPATEAAFDQELVEHEQIRRSVLTAEREAVISLRDRGVISDDVLRRVERDLDLEELRMEA